jgi:hypothetical protein
MSITVRPLRRPMASVSAAVPCNQSGAWERTGATFETVELGCCEYRGRACGYTGGISLYHPALQCGFVRQLSVPS